MILEIRHYTLKQGRRAGCPFVVWKRRLRSKTYPVS